jgi:uncharacterized protein
MSLLERISQEMKSAMLARDAERLNTIRMLKAAVINTQIEKQNENLPESDLIAIVQREVKKRRDSAEQFQQAGRAELADKEKREIIILEAFLPQPFSAAELEALIKTAIQETGAASKKEMGKVIKAVQAKAAGRADGKSISEAVGRLLP